MSSAPRRLVIHARHRGSRPSGDPCPARKFVPSGADDARVTAAPARDPAACCLVDHFTCRALEAVRVVRLTVPRRRLPTTDWSARQPRQNRRRASDSAATNARPGASTCAGWFYAAPPRAAPLEQTTPNPLVRRAVSLWSSTALGVALPVRAAVDLERLALFAAATWSSVRRSSSARARLPGRGGLPVRRPCWSRRPGRVDPPSVPRCEVRASPPYALLEVARTVGSGPRRCVLCP